MFYLLSMGWRTYNFKLQTLRWKQAYIILTIVSVHTHATCRRCTASCPCSARRHVPASKHPQMHAFQWLRAALHVTAPKVLFQAANLADAQSL
jgi:hypothetical protein